MLSFIGALLRASLSVLLSALLSAVLSALQSALQSALLSALMSALLSDKTPFQCSFEERDAHTDKISSSRAPVGAKKVEQNLV